MKRAQRRSWPVVVASFVLAGTLSACGGGGGSGSSSLDQTAQTSTGASGSASGSSSATGNVGSVGASGAPGSATVNWQAPTENVDGSPVTDLSGFNIYYGTQSQNYTSKVQVDNPGLATYVVDSLPSGTYYFVVTAYNSQGAESDYSPEASAMVN